MIARASGSVMRPSRHSTITDPATRPNLQRPAQRILHLQLGRQRLALERVLHALGQFPARRDPPGGGRDPGLEQPRDAARDPDSGADARRTDRARCGTPRWPTARTEGRRAARRRARRSRPASRASRPPSPNTACAPRPASGNLLNAPAPVGHQRLQQRGRDDRANALHAHQRHGAIDALHGQIADAIDRAVRDAQQIAGERRILRDDARHLGHGRFVVVDRRQQLRQQRRPPRNVFGPRLDALENLLHRLEHRRVLGIGRLAQGFARRVVERVRDESPQRLVPARAMRTAGRTRAGQRAVRPRGRGDGIDRRGLLSRGADPHDTRAATDDDDPPIRIASDASMQRG